MTAEDTEQRPKIEVRPARPEDKEAVLAFTARTWGDHGDYIRYVWDEWLADPNGRLFVLTLDGQPVAIDRAAIMSPREAWWEGLRVDPQHRGKGLVHHFRPALREYCRAAGVEIVRFVTSSENVIVHGMAERGGFQRVGVYTNFRATPDPSAPLEMVRLTPSDFERAWTFLQESDIFAHVRGLYVSRGWAWQELTAERLRMHLEAGDAWGLPPTPSEAPLAGLAIFVPEEPGSDELWAGYVDGTTTALPTVLRSLRRLAVDMQRPRVGAHFPRLPRMLDALEEAGFTRAFDADLWVYECPLSQLRLPSSRSS